MKEKRWPMWVAILGFVVGGLGLGAVLTETDDPLSDLVAASGYNLLDLTYAKCGVSHNGAPRCDSGTLDMHLGEHGVISYNYQANPDPTCTYIFKKTGLGPFHSGSWKAVIKWDPENPGTAGYPLGSSGFTGYLEDPTEVVHLEIDEPTPEELWAFTQRHLKEPDEKCKPEA